MLGFHPGPDGIWYDRLFWESLTHTLQFTLMSTPLIIGLGLAMALAVNNPRHRGGKIYQVAFFVPYVLPISVATLIWTNVLSPGRGILAEMLVRFGVEPISWLGDQRYAMIAIVVMTAWWTVGFNLVMFSAGLQDIDPTLYEAAMLDGAGARQRFLHVTLPGLRHVMALVLVMQVIAGFTVFGQVNIMTSGGPGNATRTLAQRAVGDEGGDHDDGRAQLPQVVEPPLHVRAPQHPDVVLDPDPLGGETQQVPVVEAHPHGLDEGVEQEEGVHREEGGDERHADARSRATDGAGTPHCALQQFIDVLLEWRESIPPGRRCQSSGADGARTVTGPRRGHPSG